ncbi:unnamed protein product [Rhizoctonia solani]|uniref:Uncharacterized protein n=1 Tax=Rhizoctonia solani TaxID=456999 RepID=A0A8H3AEM6_9AGAM|nr:unnamed protein product [Rhizoctonia solani]
MAVTIKPGLDWHYVHPIFSLPGSHIKMTQFNGGEGLFNLRASFEGRVPKGEGVHATWTDFGAPIIVTPGLSSSPGKKTWTLSKYGNPVIWFITLPGEDETKGFHYDRVEAGSLISLGYPSPFFLDLCANGTGGVFRPVDYMNGIACRSNYCIGVSEKGQVEIMNLSVPTNPKSPIPAWQAHMASWRC